MSDHPSVTNHDVAIVDGILGSANHSPDIAEMRVLVAVMEKITRAVGEMKKATPRSEHVCAHGHLRTALDYERRLLADYERRFGMIMDGIHQEVAVRSGAE